jgi:transcriptional regulator with XRE-family HTH domain
VNHGAWLRKALADTGKTQSELARHLGVEPSRVSKMLSGTRGIKAAEMEQIQAFLQTDSVAAPAARRISQSAAPSDLITYIQAVVDGGAHPTPAQWAKIVQKAGG